MKKYKFRRGWFGAQVLQVSLIISQSGFVIDWRDAGYKEAEKAAKKMNKKGVKSFSMLPMRGSWVPYL